MITLIHTYLLIGVIFTGGVFLYAAIRSNDPCRVPPLDWMICILVWPYTFCLMLHNLFGEPK